MEIKIEYIKKTKIINTRNKKFNFENNEEIDTKYITEPIEIYEEEKEDEKEYIHITIIKNDSTMYVEKAIKDLNKKIVLLKNISFEKQKIVKTISINEKIYYIYIDKKGNLCSTPKVNDIYNIKQKLYSFSTKRNIYFWGIITNTSNKADNFETVYLGENKYGKIKRPFKKWKMKHIAIIKIKIKDIVKLEKIHNEISISNNNSIHIQIISAHRAKKGMRYFCKKKYDNKIVILRTIMNGRRFNLTQIPYEKEYSIINSLKNNIAKILYPIFLHKKINLMFEKETGKANESGWYIFEKIMQYYQQKKKKSNTYFIIDKNSVDYLKTKQKYKKNIINKYSLKHYIYIYASKYFISSELSNHVINPRVYIKSLNNVISKKPLIFLQHGIMFAKPVDNPAARGFYKKNNAANIYKSVVCSDLEAEQFYKMGYSSSDLLKVGLPKFDISTMNKNADKIMLMLTYRYWEEALINNEEQIKETTYFKRYMKLIKEFEKNNLLDKLIISGHPKFITKITEKLSEYKEIVETDINKGLENCKIFITDFSSASYDAHYRGAYIIYDWEEKDYLIENYKAIPPVNEENCDGVAVYNAEDLVKEVKKAIKNNCIMEAKYQERYRKINEFSDGHNGDRLIKELQELKII